MDQLPRSRRFARPRRWRAGPATAPALALTVAMLAACGPGTDAPPSEQDGPASSRDAMRIVVVTHGQAADPYWSIVANGAEDAARDLGIDVQYQAPPTFDMIAMSDLIDAAVAARPAGLVVSIPDGAALRPALERALAAGIPIVSINSGAPVSRELGLLAHVGQPEREAGLAAGRRLAGDGVRSVLCVHHEVGNAALDDRCAGASEAMVEAGGSLDVLAVDLADPDDTEQRIRAALERGAHDAVLTLGPAAASPALAAIGEAPIRFATFDLTEDVARAIAEDRAAFAVDQQPYLQGYLPVVFLVKYAETLAVPGGGGVVPTGPGFVTSENAAQVTELVRRGIR